MSLISIYTDGSSKGNPGKGGYGIVMKTPKYRKELSAGFRLTTNNRMELLSIIVALESLKIAGSNVNVFSDSKYVVDSVEKKWLFKWEKNQFKKIKNADLWRRFLIIYRQHFVTFFWVKGHSDNSENNRCDYLAVRASEKSDLLIDCWYEKNSNC